MPRAESTTKECNFPECTNPAATRGLCKKHYWQAKNSAKPAVRQLASSYMDEPKRAAPGTKGGSKSATSKVKADPDRRFASTPRFDRPVDIPADEALGDSLEIPPALEGDQRRELIDKARSVADEAFRMMGVSSIRLPSNRGMLYVLAETGRVAHVDSTGRIRNATIRAGANNELILGTP